ncbi:MAG: HEAT repeat domain-containing protein [Lysobacterales bacterium]|nr:MAG: HEAT repeat domain-containing protein [Xanthomonadales bacterium]
MTGKPTVAAHNRHGDDSGEAESAGAGETATNAASHNLAATLAAMDGTRRALHILDALTELGFDAVTAAIARLDVAARDELARSLGTIADRGSASLLVHLLADPEGFVRETAAGAIGHTGEPAAADALLPLVDSPNHNIRKAAAFSLGELQVGAAVDSLLTMTGDPNPAVRAAAATALGKIGGGMDTEPLLQLLDDPYPDAAQMAAWTLGELRDPRAAPALERAANSKDAALARIAGAALAKLQREM